MPPAPDTRFPRVLAGLSFVLALVYLVPAGLVPPAAGDQVLLGFRFVGPPGWIASIAHGLFFLWLVYAALRRQAAAAWGAIGYCVYMIENIWIYSTGEGSVFFQNWSSMVLVNAVVTAALLAFCRFVMKRRPAFDR